MTRLSALPYSRSRIGMIRRHLNTMLEPPACWHKFDQKNPDKPHSSVIEKIVKQEMKFHWQNEQSKIKCTNI